MPSAKQKRIKRQKRYAQNKDAAKLYNEKKKDLIQLSKNEYYNSNEYKIKNLIMKETKMIKDNAM